MILDSIELVDVAIPSLNNSHSLYIIFARIESEMFYRNKQMDTMFFIDDRQKLSLFEKHRNYPEQP